MQAYLHVGGALGVHLEDLCDEWPVHETKSAMI